MSTLAPALAWGDLGSSSGRNGSNHVHFPAPLQVAEQYPATGVQMVVRRGAGSVAMLLLIAAFSSRGESAEVKVGVGKSGQATIWITGEIVPGDADKFSQSLRQANDSGKFVANVRLGSPGGNLLEGVKIAKIAFVKTVEDMTGEVIAREACTSNDFKDVRTCVNWDNGTSHRDMKDSNGVWSKVADE